MDKAPDAFRTISEVAEALETPAHVLRFWESRFTQIKPVKRAGGRRYYRPADVALLSGIRHLLHAEGMTIRGVQKVLRDQGVRHVAALGGADPGELDLEGAEELLQVEAPDPSAQIVPIESFQRPAIAALQVADLDEPPPSSDTAQTSPPSAPDLAVPQQDDGGFIAFTSPRGPRYKPKTPQTDQPSLPLLLETPTVPDQPVAQMPDPVPPRDADGPDLAAQTVSVSAPEALPDAVFGATVQASAPAGNDPVPDVPALDDADPDSTPPQSRSIDTPVDGQPKDPAPLDPQMPRPAEPAAPELAGVASRLRSLPPRPNPAMEDLHARLGLLHAQMAEALRLRR